MNEELRLVMTALPDADQQVCDLYAKDNDFRLLCRDYADVLKAIELWRQSVNSETAKRVEEYQSLAVELRGDISQCLKKSEKK